MGDEFYENFFALHGEYPKAFVSGPGIYGVGVQGKFCQKKFEFSRQKKSIYFVILTVNVTTKSCCLGLVRIFSKCFV